MTTSDFKQVTWNDICNIAIDKGFCSAELKAKDEARFQVAQLAIGLGYPDPDTEESPEEAIEYYCYEMKIRFDLYGNIVAVTTMK